MKKSDQRAEPRIAVTCYGTLTVGDKTTPCEIQNMCSRGFLIKAEDELPVGQNIHLRCELYPHCLVECTVEVRHVNRRCLGARVVEISADGQIACRRFVEEQRLAQEAAAQAA